MGQKYGFIGESGRVKAERCWYGSYGYTNDIAPSELGIERE